MGTDVKTLGEFTTARKSMDPKQMVRERYELSRKYNKSRHEECRKIYQAYHGYIDAKLKRSRRSNYHFHKLFQQIEMETARYITGIFGHKPYTSVAPTNPASVQAAQAREKVLQYYLESAPNYFLSTLRFLKYTLLYGAGYRIPTWLTEEKEVDVLYPVRMYGMDLGFYTQKEKMTTYDGLMFQTVNPMQVFPHPHTLEWTKLPWTVIEEFVHCDDLLKQAQSQSYDISKVKSIPLNGSGQDGDTYFVSCLDLGKEKPEPDPEMIRLQHCLSPGRFTTLANDEVIIRDLPNFYRHGEIPANQGMKTLDPDSLWPIGSGSKILPAQKMRNLLGNEMLNYVVMTNWPMWKYRKGRGINSDELLSYPNNRLAVTSLDDIDVVKMPELKSDIMAITSMIDSQIEEISGYWGVQKGYSNQRNTATSDSIFASQGDKRIQGDAMVMEMVSLNREAKMVNSLIDQFSPDEITVNVGGYGYGQFKTYAKDEMNGNFNYRVGGISDAVNRMMVRDSMLTLFQSGSQAQQYIRLPNGAVLPVPLQNNHYAMKALYEAFERTDAEKFLYPPELFGLPLDQNDLAANPVPGLVSKEELFANTRTGALQNRPWGQ